MKNKKEALKGTDTEAIKKATEDLQKAFYDISSKDIPTDSANQVRS